MVEVLEMVDFEELAVHTVKKAYNEYFIHKDTSFILEHCGYNEVPLLGLDKPYWDSQYMITSEHQHVDMISDNICMVIIRVCLKDTIGIEKENKYYTGTFLCKNKDCFIEFLNIHISENGGVAVKNIEDKFSEEYYKRVLHYMYDVVFEYDSLNNSFIYDPVKYKKLFQVDAHFVSMDQWFWNMCTECVKQEDTELLDIFRSNDIGKRIRNDDCVVEDDIRIKNKQKGYIWIKMVVVFVPNKNRNSLEKVFVMFKDIDDEKRRELDFEYRARMDTVTDLYNKDYADEQISAYLNSEESPSGTYVVIDINGFKGINDTFGHIAGNEILKKIGRNIYDNVGADDIVGRIGGDSFVVFMKNCDILANVENRIHNILKNVSFTYREEEIERRISCSAGAVILSKDCCKLSELYDKADKNLSEARELEDCFVKITN